MEIIMLTGYRTVSGFQKPETNFQPVNSLSGYSVIRIA